MRFSPFLFLVVALAIGVSSCEVKFNWAWNQPKDEFGRSVGSGETTTGDRTIETFRELRMEGMGKLIFDPEIPAGIVRVTADAAVLRHIQTEVTGLTGDRLVLRDDGLRGPGTWEIEYRLAPPAGLSQLVMAGMGSIEGDIAAPAAPELSVSLEGMGQIRLKISGTAVKVDQQGQGEIVLEGVAQSVEVRAQGLGKVDTSGLLTAVADVLSQGVGEVVVYASEKLKVRAQGLGAVHFKGDPAVTDVQTEGLTKVSAID